MDKSYAFKNEVMIPTSNKLKRNVSGWLIMIPSLILFGFFVWGPLLESIYLSFYSSNGMRLEKFVGLSNYISVFEYPDFKAAVINTFYYTLWSLLIGFLVPIIMAIILNEVIHLRGFFRVATYLPNVVPGLAIAMMWTFIFRPSNSGLLNIILKIFGIGPQVWLSNPKWTIPLIVFTMTWRGAGATALIYLAGLQGIDSELYEAAAIDGANIWKRLIHITIPNIYNLARTLLVLQIISVFQVLYEPLVMTNGGPNNASLSLMQLVYRYAFEKFDYPKAASVSVVIGVLLIIITALYNLVIKEKDM
ncbi:carbohydrate ABC transporter permease [Thermoanaerobacterium thermosaccharolyticum]|uniref:Carbohydrate ABC transporter membrane protein 1, CUT1 family n=1 Tax=Thermoanaerobacterium thermosaccharolyticum M0795 TaxID=698948 RepID=L0II76_THETR|nr:sugar ABC transporter permease [Thermoanaerobacterium thermosaccharolyticum]AGB17936.1 carbohydrate ABC transporter membrane protein 1, CUT1 family [Thermoanaerobacterium thermosaccharolyticum M0795]